MSSSYDAIVIGAGLGGLTTGALLATAGWRVLVAEAGPAAGGYAHAFIRNGYTFDPAIHMVPEPPFIKNLLAHVGAEIDLRPVESLFAARFPELTLEVGHTPHDVEVFLAPFLRAFPAEERNLRALYRLFEDVFDEASRLPFRVLGTDFDETKYPNLLRFRTANVQEVLDGYLTDDRLKAALTAPWSYLGLPPSKLSFLLFTQMVNVMVRGASHVVGGAQTLVDGLVHGLLSHGGELLTSSPVTKIVIEGGKVGGVRIGDDEHRAPVVVSGADGVHTLADLIGLEALKRPVAKRLDRLKPSISSFLVYAGTGMDLGAAGASHENLLFSHWDHDATYADIERALPGGMSLIVPTLHDPSLAPPGRHAVVIRALAPYDAPGRSSRSATRSSCSRSATSISPASATRSTSWRRARR